MLYNKTEFPESDNSLPKYKSILNFLYEIVSELSTKRNFQIMPPSVVR